MTGRTDVTQQASLLSFASTNSSSFGGARTGGGGGGGAGAGAGIGSGVGGAGLVFLYSNLPLSTAACHSYIGVIIYSLSTVNEHLLLDVLDQCGLLGYNPLQRFLITQFTRHSKHPFMHCSHLSLTACGMKLLQKTELSSRHPKLLACIIQSPFEVGAHAGHSTQVPSLLAVHV